MRPPPLIACVLGALLSQPLAAGAKAPSEKGGTIRVRLVTSDGPIVLALDARHAPITTANFLAYVDQQRFDGTSFYRAVQRPGQPGLGFVEGGIGPDIRRSLSPIPLEPTSQTGVHHLNGAVSMARFENPRSATGDFSILLGARPELDASPKDPGYAAFGHVLSGWNTLRRILNEPTAPEGEGKKGEMLLHPIRIISARRLDGVGAPPPRFKPWLIHYPNQHG